MKREIPLLGITPIAGAVFEIAFTYVSDTISIDLHLV